MARRSLDKVAMAAVSVVAGLALSSHGVASAAKSAASAASSATTFQPKPGGAEIMLTINIKWWRSYKVSCKDKGGPDCHVGCPKECPTKCIVSCIRCRSFCSTSMHAHEPPAPSYVSRLDIGAKMPVMGSAHKYLSSGLFSTDCAVSKFQHGGRGVTTFVS